LKKKLKQSTNIKPQHISTNNMLHNIIDFEASGLGASSYPIQVAVILSDGDTYDSYILPHDDWTFHGEWCYEAEKIHNIPANTLRDIGRPLITVAQELNDFLGNQTVYCDGGVHDLQWCDTLFWKAGITRTFKIDKVRAVMREGVNYHYQKNLSVKELNLKEHDALNDVKIIQRTVDICSGTRRYEDD